MYRLYAFINYYSTNKNHATTHDNSKPNMRSWRCCRGGHSRQWGDRQCYRGSRSRHGRDCRRYSRSSRRHRRCRWNGARARCWCQHRTSTATSVVISMVCWVRSICRQTTCAIDLCSCTGQAIPRSSRYTSMSSWVSIAQGIVQHIRIAVQGLRIGGIRYHRIRLREATQGGIIPTTAIKYKPKIRTPPVLPPVGEVSRRAARRGLTSISAAVTSRRPPPNIGM